MSFLNNSALKIHFHLIFLSSIAFALMLRAESTARDLMKINLLICISLLAWKIYKKEKSNIQPLFKLAILPLCLLILTFIATGELRYKGYSKNLILAFSITMAFVFLSPFADEKLKNLSHFYIKAMVFMYTFLQCFTLLILSKPHGTTTNPHFLAIYSAFSFFVSLYYFYNTDSKTKYFFLTNAIILLSIILYTSSRPTWIGIILSCGFLIHHIKRENLLRYFLGFICIQALLVVINIFNYRDRFIELISNISNEDRVVIWQDTWVTQMKSSLCQWIVGHGNSSFHKYFMSYSRYHAIQDFKSPHNIFLETIYTSGIIGLFVMLTFYFLLYKQLIKNRKNNLLNSRIYTLILMITTTSLVLNGLNFPFYSSSSLYPLAFIIGIIYVIEFSSKSNSHFA